MIKVKLIFLSLLFLNGTTELHQLWKLPLLTWHYQEHCKKDPTLNFFEFLRFHYSNPTGHKDNDDTNDRDLPFKSTGTIAHTDISDYTKKTISVSHTIIKNAVANTLHPEGILCHQAFSIFHPPRFS